MEKKEIKTLMDSMLFAEQLEKEIKLLETEVNSRESTCKLLDKENLKLINENNLLVSEKEEIFSKLQAYETEIHKLKNENRELKEIVKQGTFTKRTREIANSQIEEIKKLRNSGNSYRDIEKETGWSKFTIGKVLKGDYN